jgi:hypothetical protein
MGCNGNYRNDLHLTILEGAFPQERKHNSLQVVVHVKTMDGKPYEVSKIFFEDGEFLQALSLIRIQSINLKEDTISSSYPSIIFYHQVRTHLTQKTTWS